MTYDVVIPCYNAAEFLAETIASVKAQSVAPARIIAVDDGSTDDTNSVLRRHLPSEDIISQENQGPGAATMAGVQKSSARSISFIDADDLWLPQKAEVQLRVLSAASDPAIAFCRMASFNHGQNALVVNEASAGWSRSTLMLERSVFERIGPIYDTKHRVGEMVDWIARAKETDVSVIMIEDLLAQRRLHSNSLTRRTENTTEGYLDAAKAAILRRRSGRDG